METRIELVISQNNITLISQLPSSINRDTVLSYNCPNCDKQTSKSCRTFLKNHLCNICTNNNKKIPNEKSLSYLEPTVALLWHHTKNEKSPRHYTRSSMKKVWWLCEVIDNCGCPHEYEASICDMVKCKSSNSKGCPFCTNMGSNKKFCIHKSLSHLFPSICIYWSTKNSKKPSEYLPSSEEEVLWICKGCKFCGKIHEYKQKISSKTGKKRNGEIRGNSFNGGCIVCGLSTQNICNCQRLEIKYPQLYKECFIEKNEEENENFDINNIPPSSNRPLWWKCIANLEHVWRATPGNRIYNNSGCPYCNNARYYSKMAIQYLNFIAKLHKIKIIHAENEGEFKIPTTRYSADGYCNETNTIYEFHGNEYHGYPTSNFELQDCNHFGEKYSELYIKTLKREQEIKDLGFNLIVMWEHEWKKINKSIKILQRKIRCKN